MTTDVKLNDGIFHPLYNPYGWRPRFNGETRYMWNQFDDDMPAITSRKDCFKEEWIYSGSDDQKNLISGRPDGQISVYANGDTVLTEW